MEGSAEEDEGENEAEVGKNNSKILKIFKKTPNRQSLYNSRLMQT